MRHFENKNNYYLSKRDKVTEWRPLDGKIKNRCQERLLIFTARKRILQKLCFHRCLFVHGGGVSVHGGSLSREVSLQGNFCQVGLCHGDPPVTVMCERYASYWNVFLFYFGLN